MTRLTDHYPELRGEDDNPAVARAVADLEQAYAVVMPVARRAALARHLRGELVGTATSDAANSARPTTVRQAGFAGWAQRRVVRLGVVLCLALGGVATYVQGQYFAPVSAHRVLNRASGAFRNLASGRVIHTRKLLYHSDGQFDSSDGMTVTVDLWTHLDATGAISEQVATAINDVGDEMYRIVQEGQTVWRYDAGSGVVHAPSVVRGEDSSGTDNPFGLTDMRGLIGVAAARTEPRVRLAPRRTLDSATVDVVDIATLPGGRVRLYVDAHDYTIREWDEELDAPPNGQPLGWPRTLTRMRLLESDVVPPSAVPDGVFPDPSGIANAPPSLAAGHLGEATHPTVAQAVAISDLHTPLLDGAPDGLHLVGTYDSQTPQRRIIDYTYRAHPHNLGALDVKALDVQVWHWPSRGGDHAVAIYAGGQPITLTLAGQSLHGLYAASEGDAIEQHELQFQQGTTTVCIDGTRMSRDKFFATVRALVDGSTHPEVVTTLQRELDGTAS